MPEDLEKIKNELYKLNSEFSPRVVSFTGFGVDSGNAIVMNYKVPVGRYKGKNFNIALSFQEIGYPEYPPHFIHIAEIPDVILAVNQEHQFEGLQWKAFSVPPSDFWDKLPSNEKNMGTYMRRHVQRFWDQI